ncbi:hypothetical protein EV715DRAFT_165093, partial [Schizophyllum commune]
APPITIINEIDEEMVPNVQFLYTNALYWSKDDPMRESGRRGCECVGGCRATSACSCFVQQQRETAENGVRFFGYKANGLLAEAHVPVFECTRNCSCSSECRNKASVVRKGLNVPLSIKKTQKKGWALFNGTQAIPAGHYVGSYVGEVLTATEADER